MLKRARAQLLPMIIFINKSNGGSKAQKILRSRKVQVQMSSDINNITI